MNTEITDAANINGWVLYDADCHLCVRLAERFRAALARRQFELVPLQTTWVCSRLGLPESELLAEMRLLQPDGKALGGADALLEIGRQFWWAWPFRQLGRIPALMELFRAGYRWIAGHRHCAAGACAVNPKAEVRNPKAERNPLIADGVPVSRPGSMERILKRAGSGDRRSNLSAANMEPQEPHFGIRNSDLLRISGIRVSDFTPLLALPLLALVFRPRLAPWVFMWAMAFALYAGCKWLTYRVTVRTGRHGTAGIPVRLRLTGRMPVPLTGRPGTAGNPFRQSDFGFLSDSGDSGFGFQRKYGYLLVWPGMNAAEFFNRCAQAAEPRKSEWIFAMAKTSFGAFLLWAIARLALPAHPLLAGWIGMVGAIFVLHFGLIHLLSLAWRQAGVNATPLMRSPLLAHSLADFWGARWNTAFNELAFRFTFRPLRRWTTPAVATLGAFGLSGLIHELVISLPAHGGYGLPTLYFAAQGLGVVVERSPLGRSLGLGQRVRGRLFTLLVTAGPVAMLFHPPFIHHVILPMLTAIGAT